MLVPQFFDKNQREIFTPFSGLFHALREKCNSSDFNTYSSFASVFSPFFEKVCHTCATGKAFEPDGDESNDKSPFSILRYRLLSSNTKVRDTLNFPLLA
jgi:hypothetical protein